MNFQPYELKVLAELLKNYHESLQDCPNQHLDLRKEMGLSIEESHAINAGCAAMRVFSYDAESCEDWGGDRVWCAIGNQGLIEYLTERVVVEIMDLEEGDRA